MVKNVNLKYRPELDLVLKNLSLTINKGEKVAIVGRTGCGKSTLLLALTHMLEIEKSETNDSFISVNGDDIQKLGTH